MLGGTLVLGFVVHAVAEAIDESWTSGAAPDGGRLGEWAYEWVVVPERPRRLDDAGLVHRPRRRDPDADVAPGRWRTASCSCRRIYLAAFVWENVMVAKPEPARFVVLGAILIAVMVARPEGVLGEKRVEIV